MSFPVFFGLDQVALPDKPLELIIQHDTIAFCGCGHKVDILVAMLLDAIDDRSLHHGSPADTINET